MAETLLTASNIVLFGRIVEDIAVVNPTDAPQGTPQGVVSDLEQRLNHKAGTKSRPVTARFARIYGVSYEGAYTEIPAPVLFLVHGDGIAAASAAVPGPDEDHEAFYKDLRAWSYDRSDHTIRLDIDSGSFEQVLLDIGGDGGPGVSGARVSGARVSGARVSGARVSGARVSGAKHSD